MTHSFPTRRSSDLTCENGVADKFKDKTYKIDTDALRASVSVADNGLLLLSGPIVISPGMTDEAKQTVQCKVRVTDGKRSEEHTSELQSLMRISYAVFCLKKKK